MKIRIEEVDKFEDLDEAEFNDRLKNRKFKEQRKEKQRKKKDAKSNPTEED